MDHMNTIAPQIMIISGILMCIFGLIGNLLNISVFILWSFPRKKSNRLKNINHKSNTPLYLLASSFSNLILLVYPLLTRIMFDGYHYQITTSNVFFLCQLRYYILHTFYLISLTCICLATFDRYIITSRKIHLRKLITTKQQTIILILILILLIGLHSIPLVIFFDVSNIGQCIIISIIYSYYHLYVFDIFLQGLIPIIFLLIFGILTFKQLRIIMQHHRYNHLNMDRQLAHMLLLISISIILSSLPNCIERIYDIIHQTNQYEQSSRYFLYHVISSILFYSNPVTSFYIFYISTPNFRCQVRNLISSNRHDNYLVTTQIHSRITIQQN